MLIFGKSPSPVDIRDIVSPFLFFCKKTCLPQLLVCIPPYSNIDQYESFSGEDEQIQITLTFLMLVYIKWRPYELLWKTIWCILGYTLSFSWFNFESFSSLAWACRSKIVVLFCQETCRSDSFCFWLFVLMLIGKV